MPSALLVQQGQNPIQLPARFVYPRAAQGIKHVRYYGDVPVNMNVFPFEALGIAAAIPFLMMPLGHNGSGLQQLALGTPQQLIPYACVDLDDYPRNFFDFLRPFRLLLQCFLSCQKHTCYNCLYCASVAHPDRANVS